TSANSNAGLRASGSSSSSSSSSSSNSDAVTLNDLQEPDEQIEFVCTLIVDYLADAFALASSPNAQTCAAYSIQELLRRVGFTKDTVFGGNEDDNAAPLSSSSHAGRKKKRSGGPRRSHDSANSVSLRNRWEMLPPHIIEIIKPLLDSKYTIRPSTKPSADRCGGQRPLCITSTTSQLAWLRSWIVELTQLLKDSPIDGIFQVCTSAVREGSADMLLFLLPRIVYQICLLSCQQCKPIPVYDGDGDGDDEGGPDGGSEGSRVSDGDYSAKTSSVSEEIRAVLSCDSELVKMPADQWRLCKDAVINLLDVLRASARAQQAKRVANKRGSRKDSRLSNSTPEEQALMSLVESVPHPMIAAAAVSCGQFERAVLHIELSLREGAFGRCPTLFHNVDDAVVSKIQELCFSMGDADGVTGAAACRKQADRRHTILKHEVEGNWSHALISRESLLRSNPDSEEYQKGWIRCLQSMGQWEGAWAAAKDLYKLRPCNDDQKQLNNACFASAWRLGKWSWVDSVASGDTAYFADARSAASSSSINQAVHSFDALNSMLLARIGMHRSHILQILVEQWGARVACLPPIYAVQEPVLALHTRLYSILLDSCAKDPSSKNSAVCVDIINRQTVLSHLQAAQLARLAGFRSTALGILMHAELTSSTSITLLSSLQIEHAQILWDEGHAADAMSEIHRVVDCLSEKLRLRGDDEKGAGSTFTVGAAVPPSLGSEPNEGSPHDPEQITQDMDEAKAAFARASLLLLRWQKATNAVNTTMLLNRYERLLRVHEGDKVHYALGHLYDHLFTTLSDKDSSRTSKAQQDNRNLQLASLQYYVIRHYSRTVIYSSRFLFQALPRLLTVWLDFGANVLKPAEAKNTRLVERFKTANRVVSNMARRLPAYSFLVALSQLVSRICHPNEEVFSVLESTILSVLELYPQQTLWQLMGVQRSTYATRADRCNVILAKARVSQGPESMGNIGRNRSARSLGGLIQQASKLTDLLLGLCNAMPPARSVTTMYMSKDFKALDKSTPLDIIIPLQSSLVPSLPDTANSAECELALALPWTSSAGSAEAGCNAQTASQRAMLHQPFSSDLPTISGFLNEIEVMHSLQRPKKIAVVGSDGHNYSFLCKPKDDLRKDARLMEFNSMINKLLGANSQTQKRGLHIRTYAVVPLNEECGLIQWVGPTTGIRHVLLKLYKAHGVSISMTQVKSILDKSSPSPEELFTNTLLPMFPSVLHEWFLQSFPDPPRWLASRTNFTRTAAVMSMVGHILGLGDRHCENILLDQSTGGVVHVDFNCLFDKGMTLEKPEKVPFRLTHNMVDAMGITGYEGAFRKTCEMTLRLLREHKDALMSVLEAFVHDPLVEWSKRTTRSNRSAPSKDSGQPNEQAAKCLHNISRKLQGVLQGVAPLSVEGQVDELIRDATNPTRLFQMYIGWAAYM
ncbi:hypothetical protein GGI12_001602, partial [Dipsacomyces acuminosporus]